MKLGRAPRPVAQCQQGSKFIGQATILSLTCNGSRSTRNCRSPWVASCGSTRRNLGRGVVASGRWAGFSPSVWIVSIMGPLYHGSGNSIDKAVVPCYIPRESSSGVSADSNQPADRREHGLQFSPTGKVHQHARMGSDGRRGPAVVGISDYAQHLLSDVVYVELPSEGDTVTTGQALGTVESVKASEVQLADHRRSRRGEHGSRSEPGIGKRGSVWESMADQGQTQRPQRTG